MDVPSTDRNKTTTLSFGAIRWVWDWRWVLLMNLYLISPVLAYEARLRDKSALFTLAASILWLLAVQLLFARRIWITHALLLPFYVVVGIDLFVIVNYQTRLASNMIVIIVGNLEDARGFLEADFARTAGSVALVLGAYGYALWRIRDRRVTVSRAFSIVPLVAVALVYLGVHRYFGSWPLVVMNDRNSPFGVISQGYLTASLREEELRQRELAKSFHFGATRSATPEEPEIYVLVVGESARRHNFSLYGYARDTNPRLSRVDNLVVFKDVITQVAQTQVSVPLILTRGSIEDPLRSAREKSVLSVFREVGFKTFWLSSQQREIAMAAISHYTDEADVVRYFERQHDIVLVDAMRDLLGKPAGQSPRMFLMLHMLGSHFNLTSRYPRNFAVFPDGAEGGLVQGTSASSSHSELIGAYDNTILYEDYVLATLIDLLRTRPGIKAMFYVPDHGDNLRDDERNLFGHAHSNEYDLPIPLLFWYSDEYARRFPDKVTTARQNAGRPLNTRTVFYSLADMAGISVRDPESARLSVFSPSLVNVKRMVAGWPRPFDFDEWMARTGTTIPTATPPN